MVCSNKLRVQGSPIRHKNPSNDSKPWIYDEKYSVFKFLVRGDERHSKNGLHTHGQSLLALLGTVPIANSKSEELENMIVAFPQLCRK